MDSSTPPNLSVILVAPGDYTTIRKTGGHLRRQTVCDQLEIVIVAPSEGTLGLRADELKEMCQFAVVEVGCIRSVGTAKAAGVRVASAPIVVFAEDHCYPEPEWAEALINAHQGPWAAVGPVLRNANPDSAISLSDMLIGYGPWIDPTPAGVADHLPPNNSAYKRDLLLPYGRELDILLNADTVLQWDLRTRGYQLYLEAAAKTNHLNFSLLVPALKAHFYAGLIFAAARALRWSWLRRLVYALASPLIPFIRLWRTWREAWRPGRPRRLVWRALPMMLVSLTLDGAGQMVGYVSGAGDVARQEFSRLETERVRYIRPADRNLTNS
jgi:hypothetical protein